MAELKKLADEAAEELLKAIRDQARNATDLKLLQLAEAYSLVVSAEVTATLADDDGPWEAEPAQSWQAPITPE